MDLLFGSGSHILFLFYGKFNISSINSMGIFPQVLEVLNETFTAVPTFMMKSEQLKNLIR
jgi:hypothetical protein